MYGKEEKEEAALCGAEEEAALCWALKYLGIQFCEKIYISLEENNTFGMKQTKLLPLQYVSGDSFWLLHGCYRRRRL